MRKNILIIDDSALMRKVLSDIIKTDRRFHIAGMAENGIEALKLLEQNAGRYDLLILDINMPKMNGLQLMEELNKRFLKLRILIVSTVATDGAAETIRALELGAFDFVTKPASFIETKGARFQNQLLLMMAMALGMKVTVVTEEVETEEVTPERPARKASYQERMLKESKAVGEGRNEKTASKRFVRPGERLVALACSTGGPKALQSVIPYLPENLDAPMLIVQHMPAGFTASLAARLNEISPIHVKEAEENEILEKGVVYIAKGGKQLKLEQNASVRYRISLTDEPPRNGLRPCADIMYESLRDTYFEEIVCTVLTGMGGDGTEGIKGLHKTNKIKVIAQDEATSVVYGMPKVIWESGLVDKVLPLEEIAAAITQYVGVR